VTRNGVTNWFEVFGGKDESSYTLIQGRTFAGVLMDEVALMPRSFVEQAPARCSIDGARAWFSCNPGSPSHWFYQEWIKDPKVHNVLYLHFRMEDNPSLSKETLERYRTMFKGVFYKRYILGLWCAAEGLIYQHFAENEQRYQIHRDQVPPLSYIEIGADVGGNKSNHAYVAAGYTATRDAMYVLKAWSYRATGVTVTQYRENLLKFADEVFDDYGFLDTIWVDNAEAAIVNEVSAHSRYHVRGCIKEEIIDRIRCADVLFSQGRIKLVAGACDDLCAGLREAVWDEKHDDEPLDDGSYDRDVIDAFDYSMTPHITQLLRG
jgi:PBSX family phage terminase large subunit